MSCLIMASGPLEAPVTHELPERMPHNVKLNWLRGLSIAIKEKSEVVIHRPNGQIRDKDSYGNDPFPPKG